MTEYTQDFFDLITKGSIKSASKVVPIVNKIVKPKSVLDIGGGNGAWLQAWPKVGVKDILCVDGDYVDVENLQIPKDKFMPHDLTKPLNLKRKFDLAMTLEVAEHLDKRYAKTFVKSLTTHSDVIFFSAALPGQSGVHHVNEQWASYWAKLFADQGYKCYDVLRPQIWTDKDIELWYRQNCLIFATNKAAKRLKLVASIAPLDVVHPELFSYHLNALKPSPTNETVSAEPVKAKASQRLKSKLRKLKSSLPI